MKISGIYTLFASIEEYTIKLERGVYNKTKFIIIVIIIVVVVVVVAVIIIIVVI